MKHITDKVCRSDQAQRIRLPYWQRGLSLIELIVFIVVMSIAVVAVMQGLSSSLRGSLTPGQITQATQLAQQRMEFILSRRQTLGYTDFQTDLCPSAAVPCADPLDGFTIASTVGAWSGNPTTEYLLVTVIVTRNNQQVAQLRSVVSNY